MNKKGFALLTSIILLVSIICLFNIIPAEAEKYQPSDYDPTFSGTYYVWGDSVSRATYTADGGACSKLPLNASGIFTYQMVNYNIDTGAIGGSPQYFYNDTAFDWGGQTSSWGISKWNNVDDKGCGTDCAVANHTSNTVVFELFGINDLCHGTSAAACANNKYTMFTMAMAAGMEEEYWIPCIWTIISSNWSGTYSKAAYSQQFAYMNASVDKFEAKSIRYLKMYDAIDINPYNGRYDPIYDTYYYDTACTGASAMHPNNEGHALLGNFSWFFLNGQDKTITYPSNTRTQIACNYNQTIYLHLRDGWAYGNTTIYCLNTSTNISWTQEVNYSGSSMIHFSGIDGYTYYARAGWDGPMEGDIHFISIDGGVNGTTTYDTTPTFNWSIVSDSIMYWLQISNSSSFTPLIVNISNINEIEYPTKYSENATRVSFILPDAYAFSEYKTYYCRVRALT